MTKPSKPATRAKAQKPEPVKEAEAAGENPGRSGKELTVVASADRWRSGLFFPARQETPVSTDNLSEAQVEAILNDPVLVIKKG